MKKSELGIISTWTKGLVVQWQVLWAGGSGDLRSLFWSILPCSHGQVTRIRSFQLWYQPTWWHRQAIQPHLDSISSSIKEYQPPRIVRKEWHFWRMWKKILSETCYKITRDYFHCSIVFMDAVLTTIVNTVIETKQHDRWYGWPTKCHFPLPYFLPGSSTEAGK